MHEQQTLAHFYKPATYFQMSYSTPNVNSRKLSVEHSVSTVRLRISLTKTDLYDGNRHKVPPSHTASLTSNKGLLPEKQVCKGNEQTALEAAVTNCSCEGHSAHGIHDSGMLRTGTITSALYAFCGRWQAVWPYACVI